MGALVFRTDRVRVRAPATSANLGPGFDALGLALGYYDELRVGVGESGLSVTVTGEAADDVPRDERHLVVRSMQAAFDHMGGRPGGLSLSCRNRIPHGRGLGSSSAAIIGGIVAARALVSDGDARLTDDDALRLATQIEGHPDNVAAALLGGFTLAWTDTQGPHAVRLEPAGSLRAVVFVPGTAVATMAARRLLPPQVSHADAAHNAGRAALLVEALTRRPELLLAATDDRLHQRYRAPAMPASAALVDVLREDGVPAVISGAGPTVLALVAAADADDVAGLAPAGFAASVLPLVPAGAAVLPPAP